MTAMLILSAGHGNVLSVAMCIRFSTGKSANKPLEGRKPLNSATQRVSNMSKLFFVNIPYN